MKKLSHQNATPSRKEKKKQSNGKKYKTNKEKLALQVGMQFNEVDKLLSEETLRSMLITKNKTKKKHKKKTRPPADGNNRNCTCGPCNRGGECSNSSPNQQV